MSDTDLDSRESATPGRATPVSADIHVNGTEDRDAPQEATTPPSVRTRHQSSRSKVRHNAPKDRLVSSHRSSAPIQERGRADAVIVPIFGALAGLVAITAVGVLLATRRKAKEHRLPWSHVHDLPEQLRKEIAAAERYVGSAFATFISRNRRKYGL